MLAGGCWTSLSFHGPGLRAGDLSDVAMIWVAAPAREWVHMWVQEEEDFDSQLFLDQGVAAL